VRAKQDRLAYRASLDQILSAQRQQAAADESEIAGGVIGKHFAHGIAQQNPGIRCDPGITQYGTPLHDKPICRNQCGNLVKPLRMTRDNHDQPVLPPRLHKPFAASLKLTFTRDGDKQIPITWGSSFNVIVTNTEKIRIQKPNIRNGNGQLSVLTGSKSEEAIELANLRLQAIASLPHLAVFSDEAHHTYGQKLLGKWEKNKETGGMEFKADGIKKVRRTIDYLAQETNLIVVINATGTPYFERQPLRDVVVWYGLGEGIRDGVLKELANNIKVFELGDSEAETLVATVIKDFVRDYWAVSLPNGAPARLALYFPNLETRDELRGAIESALALNGIGNDVLLAVDGNSSEAIRRDFEAVARNPESPHRILLLVNMGTEGWNCPSLFATALVRKLTNSNNFVLQAATRCLRQVPGNTTPARVYLTGSNKKPWKPNWPKPTAPACGNWAPSTPNGWKKKSCCTSLTCRRYSSRSVCCASGARP